MPSSPYPRSEAIRWLTKPILFPSKWFDDGGRRMWMVWAGDFCNHNLAAPKFAYGFTVQQMELLLV